MPRKSLLTFFLLSVFAFYPFLMGASSLGGGGCGTLTEEPTPNPDITLLSIAVTPADQSLLIESSEQYAATGTYSDGSTANLSTLVDWSSSDESFVTIDAAGLATAGSSETSSPVTISASLDSITGSTGVSVVDETPAVNNLSVSSGPTAGGTSVILTGLNFTGATSVQFGSTEASSFTVDSDTQISAVSPAASAGSVNITVTTPFGTSAAGSANQFTYANAPSVSSVSPNSGLSSGGTSVTITGSNLTGATDVQFGSTSATSFTVDSDSQISAVSPASTDDTVHVTVTTAFGTSATSSADQFTYGSAPTVTGISPSSGSTAGGTSVIITGTSFSSTSTVDFGSTAASSFVIDSDTQISAVSPASSAGTVNITVTTPYGTSATSSADEFTYAEPPTVTGLSRRGGSINGGETFFIAGTNFTGATDVLFGSTSASSFSITSSSSITVVAPAASAGLVNIQVVTSGGTSATSAASQYMIGNTHGYIVDNGGEVYYCSVDPTSGLFTSCSATPTGSPGWFNVHAIAFALADDGNPFAYVTDEGGSEVYRCSLNSDGTFTSSTCSTTPASNPFSSPTGIAFATVNGTQYAYVADFGNAEVYRCSLNSDGTFENGSCSATPSSGAPWTAGFGTAYDIAFTTVNGTQYAYVADNQHGASSTGFVWKCSVDSDGGLSSCVNTLAGGVGTSPASVDFTTVDGTQRAYVGQTNSQNLYVCDLNSDGTFSSCSSSSINSSSRVRNVMFEIFNGVQYGYLQDNNDNYQGTLNTSTGNFNAFSATSGGVSFFNPTGGAFWFSPDP